MSNYNNASEMKWQMYDIKGTIKFYSPYTIKDKPFFSTLCSWLIRQEVIRISLCLTKYVTA